MCSTGKFRKKPVTKPGQKLPDVSAVHVAALNTGPRVQLEVETLDHMKLGKVNAIPDTGAQCTVTGEQFLIQTGQNKEDLKVVANEKLLGITGANLGPLGEKNCILKLDGRRTEQTVTVCKNVSGFYLSETGCKQLGIIPKNFPQARFPYDVSSVAAVELTSGSRQGEGGSHSSKS